MKDIWPLFGLLRENYITEVVLIRRYHSYYLAAQLELFPLRAKVQPAGCKFSIVTLHLMVNMITDMARMDYSIKLINLRLI